MNLVTTQTSNKRRPFLETNRQTTHQGRRARTGASSSPRALLEAHEGAGDLCSVRLQFYRPTAIQAYVAGDFNNWSPTATPMLRQLDGTWIADLILAPGVYEYRFFADGQWHDDPKAAATSRNPFGGINAVFQVEAL